MESSPFIAVRPIKPAAPYIGGKRNLAKRLVGLIEATPHRTYAEPFVGMGGVFLKRRQRPPAEVINDRSRDVWCLYRVLQDHHQAFLDYMKFWLSSRAGFERLMAVDPRHLTDIQRAARFLYLQRQAFGGKVSGLYFGMQTHRASRFDITRLASMLEDLHDRLAGVVVEDMPFADFIRRYDSPETLFYLDPPYWGSETDYGAELFDRSQFAALVDSLKGLSGRFILSLNDRSETRELLKDFKLEGVDTAYSLQGGAGHVAKELIACGP